MPIPGQVTGDVREVIVADVLTVDMVAVRRSMTLDIPEGEFPFANPPVLEFRNTPNGREELQNSILPKNWISAIMLVWGDKPTQEDDLPPPEPDPHPPYEPEEPEEPDPEQEPETDE